MLRTLRKPMQGFGVTSVLVVNCYLRYWNTIWYLNGKILNKINKNGPDRAVLKNKNLKAFSASNMSRIYSFPCQKSSLSQNRDPGLSKYMVMKLY